MYDRKREVWTTEMVTVREYLERPTAEFPQGSYLETIGDRVTMATGRFSGLGPPSLYWHGGPPFAVYQFDKWPWVTSRN